MVIARQDLQYTADKCEIYMLY